MRTITMKKVSSNSIESEHFKINKNELLGLFKDQSELRMDEMIKVIADKKSMSWTFDKSNVTVFAIHQPDESYDLYFRFSGKVKDINELYEQLVLPVELHNIIDR